MFKRSRKNDGYCDRPFNGFYQWNPWLIILVPCVLLVIYPIAWGMNEELTDDEVASIVISTSSFLVN